MSEDVVNNLIKSVEFAKAYCTENRMILVRVDVPPHIYHTLKDHYCKYVNEISIHPCRFYGVPIGINKDIKKPQYIMEMSNDDLEGLK